MDKKVSIIMDELLHKNLKQEAKIHDVSINKYLNKLIEDATENKIFDEKKELDYIKNILNKQNSKLELLQKIMLQLFANMGFQINEDVYDDECINEIFGSKKMSFYD